MKSWLFVALLAIAGGLSACAAPQQSTDQRLLFAPAASYHAYVVRFVNDDVAITDHFPGLRDCMIAADTDGFTVDEMQVLDKFAATPTRTNWQTAIEIRSHLAQRRGMTNDEYAVSKCGNIRADHGAFAGGRDLFKRRDEARIGRMLAALNVTAGVQSEIYDCLWTAAQHRLSTDQLAAFDRYAKGAGDLTWDVEKNLSAANVDMATWCPATLAKLPSHAQLKSQI